MLYLTNVFKDLEIEAVVLCVPIISYFEAFKSNSENRQ